MAKYNKTDEPLRKAKEFNKIEESVRIGEEHKLRTLNKVKIGSRLYFEGENWFESGHLLEEATDIITLDGEKIQKCKQRNFMQGYFAKVHDLGYSLGYDGCTIDMLPVKYVNYTQFLNGYKEGILALEKGIKKR